MAHLGASYLEHYLNGFGDALAINKDQEQKVRAVMQRVVKKIQEKSKFKPDRDRPAGSLEKGTALTQYMDVDLVLYLNSAGPYDKVISDWEDIVMLNFNVDKDLRAGKRSLQFAIDGIGIDVLPARNLVERATENVIDDQYNKMLQLVRQHPNPVQSAADNSAGLSEATVKFLKQQSAETHRLVRLCKYWNLTIYTKNYISGRSSVVELLAIHASAEETALSYKWSILTAFRRFLRMWNDALSQKQFPVNGFALYHDSEIPQGIKTQKPLLMDPASPWNNRFHSFSREDLTLFAKCANVTIERLRVAELAPYQATPMHYRQILHQLFWPQPVIYMLPQNEQPFSKPTKWLIGVHAGWSFTLPTVEQRKKDKGKIHEVVLKLFAAVVGLAVAGDRNQSAAEAAERAMKEVQDFVGEILNAGTIWTSSNESHEDYDVTYNVPLCDAEKRVVRISASW